MAYKTQGLVLRVPQIRFVHTVSQAQFIQTSTWLNQPDHRHRATPAKCLQSPSLQGVSQGSPNHHQPLLWQCIRYRMRDSRGQRAAPSPCRPAVHLPSGRSELQTPELWPRSSVQGPSITSTWAICSNGNLDKGLDYSVVPCIPGSAKQESHHTSRRGTTHTPTPKEISLWQWKSPSKMVPRIEIWVSSCTGHLGHVYSSL